MKWITRELIRKFVDNRAEFIFVPKDLAFVEAKELAAIPYDIPGAEYTHIGGQSGFAQQEKHTWSQKL